MPSQQHQTVKISSEQQNIINLLNQNFNVVVDAVAGAGKSTTVIYAAREFAQRTILQVTYNASLRQELKEKTAQLRINNLEVHTYHSLAVKYYAPHDSFTDTGIRNLLYHKTCVEPNLPLYDLIVLDEVQDMTPLYFEFIVKFITDILLRNGRKYPQLLILGDYKQSLYEFKGSDPRFLTHITEIMGGSGKEGVVGITQREFRTAKLSTSYRITKPMADFVNKVLLDDERMCVCKDGPSVSYMKNSMMHISGHIVFTIRDLIENHGARPDDFFILAGSIKHGRVKDIVNELVMREFACYMPIFENESMDDKVIQGKIVFSTFHSVKGRQRPFVFLLGFGQKYMEQMVRDNPHNICPNTLYVGCTRATQQLYVYEYEDDALPSFVKYGHVELKRAEFIDYDGLCLSSSSEKSTSSITSATDDLINTPPSPSSIEMAASITTTPVIKYTTPTELIRFIADDIYEVLTPLVEEVFVTERAALETPINIPIIYKMNNGKYEEVSDINGVAIPCIFYDHLFYKRRWMTENSMTSIQKIIQEKLQQLQCKYRSKSTQRFLSMIEQRVATASIPVEQAGPEQYLHLTNIYNALNEKVYFRLFQITDKDYRWLCKTHINQAFKIFKYAVQPEIQKCTEPGQVKMEQTIIHTDDDYTEMDALLKQHNIPLFRLEARVDLVTPSTVWEIKCTSKITIEHKLQLIIYAWIWQIQFPHTKREFKLLNIKTGELYVCNASSQQLMEIMCHLFRNKYYKSTHKTDTEFIDFCHNILEYYHK